MRLVRGGSIVLERLVMRNIVALGKAVAANVGGLAITEAALEPSPADAFCIQQIADVLAAHGNCFTRRALVKGRLRIADHRPCHNVAGKKRYDSRGARGLARN